MNSHKRKSIVQELEIFSSELREYYGLRQIMRTRKLKDDVLDYISNLRRTLVKKAGRYRKLIYEITEIDKLPIVVGHKEYFTDIWNVGLLVNPVTRTPTALNHCIDTIGQAIGKLEDDIEMGIRAKETGLLVTPQTKMTTEAPKAFIAHEGETKALDKLKVFLDALGVTYLIAEIESSNGRLVEGQVDWSQGQADFAIILATRGKMINKETGKPQMGTNVADELGRARQVFKNRIILLLETGLEAHTNIGGIVRARFSPQSMDKAFTKIVNELKNWNFLRAGKVEE